MLGVTEDESDFAVAEGLAALERFDQDLQAKGRAILDQVEYDNKVAILVIGRPYHLDPGPCTTASPTSSRSSATRF